LIGRFTNRSCEDGRTYIYTISKILINQLSDVFEVFPDSSRATIFLSKNIPKCAKKFEDIKEAIRN
jgi:hypothetical protein